MRPENVVKTIDVPIYFFAVKQGQTKLLQTSEKDHNTVTLDLKTQTESENPNQKIPLNCIVNCKSKFS